MYKEFPILYVKDVGVLLPIPKILKALKDVIRPTSATLKLCASATCSAINLTLAGSFLLPLYGTGVKNGESVSKRI